MQHSIDWDAPAKLILSDHVTQFGDGYRQLVGTTTIATGTADEVLAVARRLPNKDASKAYIMNDAGIVPFTLEELEAQLRSRKQ